MNKKVFRNLSYGVYVVSTLDGTRPTGCTANSVMQITSEPASIAISINHDNVHQWLYRQNRDICSIYSVRRFRPGPDRHLWIPVRKRRGQIRRHGPHHPGRHACPRRLLRLYCLPRHRQNGNIHSHRIFRRSHRRRRIRDRSRHDLRLLSQRDQRQEPQKCAHLSSGRRSGPSLRPAGCAASADTCMTARFPSKNCRRTIPARYAGSQNPNSSGNKCEQNVKGDVDLLQRSTSPFTFCSHFS